MYDLPIPTEPEDGSVVLDREAKAWQRLSDRWFRVAVVVPIFGGLGEATGLRWADLLVRFGPLAPMVAESAIDDYLTDGGQGWRAANYTGPDCATFVDPEDAPVSPSSPDVATPAAGLAAAPVGCDSPSVVQAAQGDPYATAPAEQAYPAAFWGDSIVAPPRPAPRPVTDRPQA